MHYLLVTSCLESHILEQLEKIFNYEYMVVSKMIKMVEQMDENDLSNDSNTTRGFEK